jgi:hypothetical protein
VTRISFNRRLRGHLALAWLTTVPFSSERQGRVRA